MSLINQLEKYKWQKEEFIFDSLMFIIKNTKILNILSKIKKKFCFIIN